MITSVRNSVEFLWFSYSTPTPKNGAQIFTLLLCCLAISTVTGALLFYWLNGLLMYEMQPAAIIAGIYAGVIAILLFLVHPFRCAFTLMFPTLGTRQGRKLVLSMCAMIVALYVLPNIVTNITTITHLMKCMSENLAHSLLNSLDLDLSKNMTTELQKTKDKMFMDVPHVQIFDHSTDVNVLTLRERLRTLSEDVEEDFSKVKQQLEEVRLLTSRILATIFVLYLLMESTMYLKLYLTSVRFDNIYVTGLLRNTAADIGIHVEAKDVKNGMNSTSFKLAKRELIKCLTPILLITLYLLMTTILILLDYIVHYLVITARPWLMDIPSTDITIQMDFKVEYLYSICEIFRICKQQVLVDVSKEYHVTVSSDTSQCEARPSELKPGVLVLLGLLYLLAYCLAILQAYAQRLHRKVASSFFPQQEEKRIRFLIQKIQKKRQKRLNAEAEPKSVEEKMRGNNR
ncbi:osteoclast stimulatory transmembrane protein [Electrophorus electricus]|uniref:osteoclast stimulatory transmembrane protein n=1 Tax=Electrophorus electricus TaxID=8005 RepID=UPI0015CFB4C8|nr:osteoclast stimulatory transmembrane protein [Electrophorus electricus]